MQADRNKTGFIFNIQKFSVNDGPGIRTVVFFKGCPLHCSWCSNPESQAVRIDILYDQKQCLRCLHCIDICPMHAVSVKGDHICIDHSICEGCKQCVLECPGHALSAEGETVTVQKVLDTVLQDQVFYEESGGGITLSGGEMLAQPAFAIELLKAAKEEGLHTCCETTGYASKEVFKKIIPYLDCMLFDMKHYDPTKHKDGTGVTNELPFNNLKHAIEIGKKVLPRIPVIPGFNDSLEDAEGFSKQLSKAGAKMVQLLPFHQFGENKYDLLGKEYAYHSTAALHNEDLKDYLQVFIDNGIDAYITR